MDIAGIKVVVDPFMAPNEWRLMASAEVNPLHKLALDLTEAGHSVEVDRDIPGLFRINGGPELTIFQFMQAGRDLLR
jgi:hypothetical protein